MKVLILIFLFVVIYVLFFFRWKKKNQTFYLKNKPIIFGHRGSPCYITENTIASFEKALDQKVDGLEFDVRCTKDKKVIIFHDKNLKRLAGKNKNIKSLTLHEIKKIKLKNGAEIPRLQEVVPLLQKTKVVNIEIKSDSLFSGFDTIPAVIDFIKINNLEKKCIISSFNPLILLKIKIRSPEMIIGYLYNKKTIFHTWYNLVWITRVRPDSLHIHYSLLDSWIVKWSKRQGLKINSYTVNDKKVLKKTKIDGVFTDNKEYLK